MKSQDSHYAKQKPGEDKFDHKTNNLIEKIRELEKKVEEKNIIIEELHRYEMGNVENIYHALFKSTREAQIVLSRNGEIIEVNTAAEKLYGYSRDEFLRINPGELIHPDYQYKLKKFKKDILESGQYTAETRHIRKDGSSFMAEISGSRIVFNKEPHLFAFVRDISEKKQLENERERLVENLEERIKEVECLYSILSVSQKEIKNVEEYLRDIASIIPEGWQFPENTSARIVYRGISVQGDGFSEYVPQFKEEINYPVENSGSITVCVNGLESAKESYRFLTEEKKLLASIAEIVEQTLKNHENSKDLKESEQNFRELIERSPVPKILYDSDNNLILLNKNFTRYYGFTIKDIPTIDDWWQLAFRDREYRESKKAELITEVNSAVNENREFNPIEAEISAKNGEKHYISISGSKINDKLLFVFYDITSRVRIEEERDRFFKVSLDLLCIANTDGYFTRINPAWETLLGFTKEELLKTPFLEFVHPDDREATLTEVKKLSEGNVTISFTNRYLCKDGSYKWLKWNTVPFGKTLYSAATDITDIKQAEESLINKSLELKRSNEELEQFAYVASHDLQEPLRMVSSYTQLLERRYKDTLDDKANMYIHYAVDGANRMQKLIIDLLEYSRITTRGNEFEKIDCHEILGRAVASLSLTIREKKALVTQDELPEIVADGDQIERVFLNLIGNAIKFNNEDIPLVHISAKKEKKFWIFSVRDNGIGIEESFREKVFVIFQRLHGRKEYQGTGIGLSICKRIINRHGGTIWFDSEPGKGTTFYFTIPVKNKGKFK